MKSMSTQSEDRERYHSNIANKHLHSSGSISTGAADLTSCPAFTSCLGAFILREERCAFFVTIGEKAAVEPTRAMRVVTRTLMILN